MKGYDLGDWVLQGVQRGGLLGPYQMGSMRSGSELTWRAQSSRSSTS